MKRAKQKLNNVVAVAVTANVDGAGAIANVFYSFLVHWLRVESIILLANSGCVHHFHRNNDYHFIFHSVGIIRLSLNLYTRHLLHHRYKDSVYSL